MTDVTKGIECSYCKQQTLHVTHAHDFGIIMTLISCGLLLPAYLFNVFVLKHYKCQTCGTYNK